MKKNIVILGGGFGGVSATLTLLKKFKSNEFNSYKIILIEKHKYHTFTPLLYEIACYIDKKTENEKLKEIVTLDLSYIFEKFIKENKLEIINDEVISLDIKNKLVKLKQNVSITYNYLILALGSEINYPPIKYTSSSFLTIKNVKDALLIREKLTFLSQSGNENKNFKVVIGGGGPTGIELAAEIKTQIKNCEVTIINAAPKILNTLEEIVSKKAEKRLQKLEVEIINNEFIQEIKDDEIVLKSGEKIKNNLLILSLGVKPNKIVENLNLPKNQQGRLKVNNYLKTESIFAIGDIAVLEDENGKIKTPTFAHFAIVEGKVAATNILREIRLKNLKEFKPKKYPYIIPLGGKYALAKIGPFLLSNLLGWILKGLAELNYFLTILSPLKAIKLWIKGLLIFLRNKKLG